MRAGPSAHLAPAPSIRSGGPGRGHPPESVCSGSRCLVPNKTLAEHEIEGRYAERWRYFVLDRCRLYLGANDAKDLVYEFALLEADTDGCVERQGPST